MPVSLAAEVHFIRFNSKYTLGGNYLHTVEGSSISSNRPDQTSNHTQCDLYDYIFILFYYSLFGIISKATFPELNTLYNESYRHTFEFSYIM